MVDSLKKPNLSMLVLIFSSVTYGQDLNSQQDLFSLSLQELASIEVITASKRYEPITESPGILTVVTRDEIKAFGAKNIRDILARTPNLFTFDSHTFISSASTLRGGANQDINNHLLYLLNGRPIRESQNGGMHADINLFFPVDAIERIEINRGPGSVLYGSNAFNGTINIITRKPSSNEIGRLVVAQGSHEYKQYSTELAYQKNDGNYVKVNVSKLDTAGELIAGFDQSSIYQTRELAMDNELIHLSAGYKGLSLAVLDTNSNIPAFSSGFVWENQANFNFERTFVDVGYEYRFSNEWRSSINYTLNDTARTVELDSAVFEFSADGDQLEVFAQGPLTDNLNLAVGHIVDRLRGDLGATRGGKYKSYRNSSYFQGDFEVNQQHTIVMGFQWNKPDAIDGRLSPRLGLISRINGNWKSKLLYGEAFRSPYGVENFFKGFLNGNEDLKPETIKTYDAQLSYQGESLNSSVNLYHSQAEDSIVRLETADGRVFINQDGKVSFQGLEWESLWEINLGWRVQSAISYQENKSSNGDKPATLAPKTMIKLGISHHSSVYTLGLWNSYVRDISKLEDLSGDVSIDVNPDAQDFNLLSINLNVDLAKLLNIGDVKHLSVSIYADNILGEDVYYPLLSNRQVNTYPQSYGEGVYATLNYRF